MNINVLLTCSDMFMMLSIDLIDNVKKLILTSELICLLGSNVISWLPFRTEVALHLCSARGCYQNICTVFSGGSLCWVCFLLFFV